MRPTVPAARVSTDWNCAREIAIASCNARLNKRSNASTTEVDGVMGYQAPTVAPAYTHPRPAAVLPSIMMCPAVLSSGSTRIFSGHTDQILSVAHSPDGRRIAFQVMGERREMENLDSSVMRIGYDGQNGHPYYAIGRELIKRGELDKDTVSLQSIRTCL